MHGLTTHECLALLRSLIPAEFGRDQGQRAEPPDPAVIDEETRLDGETLRLDSLGRLNLASALNRTFCLHELGTEDRLLTLRRVGDMAEFLAEASTRTSGLVFTTSGSTGDPQPHHHCWAAIDQEARALATALGEHGRVIAWLPTRHLYGFMLGIALPRALGVPAVEEPEALAALSRNPANGDLLATIPPRWRYLADSGRAFSGATTGVSSTAAMETPLREALLSRGLAGLAEIYGATETGGVGLRWAPETSYRLLPHWRALTSGDLERRLPDGRTITQAPLDRLEWQADGSFQPVGRIDDVVQIGGVNVSPSHIAERIRGHDAVADCAVRPFGAGSRTRLKAFIVPADIGGDWDAIHQELEHWIWKNLADVERPVHLRFGEELPRNEMGKLTDWD